MDSISPEAGRERAIVAVRGLRAAGIVEGLAYVALVFFAMPIKYGLGQPLYVQIFGNVHGLLFLWFAFALVRAHLERGWAAALSLRVFVAGVVPFGFLFVERRLKAELEAAEAPLAPVAG